jgi:hypothetical protein
MRYVQMRWVGDHTLDRVHHAGGRIAVETFVERRFGFPDVPLVVVRDSEMIAAA